MKTVLIIVAAIIIVAIGALVLRNILESVPYKRLPTSNSIEPSPTPEQTYQSFCTASQLTGTAETDVAAGNAYVTITIINTSDTACDVIGNNTPEVSYPNAVTNVQISVKDEPQTSVFTLQPNDSIYALIHYPNGPQCSTESTTVDAMVSYQFSDSEAIAFTPNVGTTILISSCAEASEITMVDVYHFSSSPVTP